MTLNYLIADSVRARMVAITEQVKSTLDQLHAETAPDLPTWTRDTRTAYEQHHANWSAAAARMPPALGRAEAALAEVSGGYFRTQGGI